MTLGFSAKLGLGPMAAWGQAWDEAGPVGSSPLSLGEIPALLHAPHLPPAALLEGHWWGNAPDREWGRGKAQAAVVCLSPEIWSGREPLTASSLSVSLPAFLLPLPSLLPPSPLSFHLMWRRAVCHSRVCTEKGSEVSASARRLSFDPCPEACLTAKKSMETKRLSQSDS